MLIQQLSIEYLITCYPFSFKFSDKFNENREQEIRRFKHDQIHFDKKGFGFLNRKGFGLTSGS